MLFHMKWTLDDLEGQYTLLRLNGAR